MGNANATDGLRGKVLDLAELVQYQEGAIVSRTIIQRDIGTVTLFAFDRGESLSEHTAPFDAMVQVLDGEAEVTIEGNPLAVAAGQMVIMPAHKPHALRATGRFKMMLVMIRA
jgi:quercetin dioxygenase-like cupin family protein